MKKSEKKEHGRKGIAPSRISNIALICCFALVLCCTLAVKAVDKVGLPIPSVLNSSVNPPGIEGRAIYSGPDSWTAVPDPIGNPGRLESLCVRLPPLYHAASLNPPSCEPIPKWYQLAGVA